MLTFFVVYVVVWCSSLYWALRCVHTTRDDHEHVLDLIGALANSADRLRYLRNMDADSTFAPHFWRVVTFRDPWVVHHPLIQSLVRVAA
jgi:hypothetical protein